MADSISHRLTALIQLSVLLVLNFAVLPLSTIVAVISWIKNGVQRGYGLRTQPRRSSTILVTNGATPAGLAITRILHDAGHFVIAADTKKPALLSSTRVSRSVNQVSHLRSASPYSRRTIPGRLRTFLTPLKGRSFSSNGHNTELQQLQQIVQRERPTLWVPCDSSLLPAPLRFTSNRANGNPGRRLLASKDDLPERDAFFQVASATDTDIHAPVRKQVSTRGEIHKILSAATGSGREFILLPDLHNVSQKVILPRATLNDTYQTVADLEVSSLQSWMLRETICGKLLLAHGLVVHGVLKALVASEYADYVLYDNSESLPIPPPENLKLLTPEGPQHRAIIAFVDSLAHAFGNDVSTHISVWFCASEVPALSGSRTIIHALDYDLSPHALLSCLSDRKALADAYVQAASAPSPQLKNDDDASTLANGYSPKNVLVALAPVRGIYSLPGTVMNELVIPLSRFVLLQGLFSDILRGLAVTFERLASWKEQTFDKRDPWPSWVYWHIHYPLQIVQQAWRKHILMTD